MLLATTVKIMMVVGFGFQTVSQRSSQRSPSFMTKLEMLLGLRMAEISTQPQAANLNISREVLGSPLFQIFHRLPQSASGQIPRTMST